MTNEQQQEEEQQQQQPAGEEEELMLRLQSQFGDMDLSNLMVTSGGGAEDDNAASNKSSSSEESSLAEPSPEELLAWQEAQFEKGRAQLEAKQEASKSAVQRRRDELKKKKQTDVAVVVDKDVDDDWEQLPGLPHLHPHGSVFFPDNDTNDQLDLVGVPPLLQELCMSKQGDPDILGTKWQCLYSSAQGDGLNFLRLWSKLQGYTGPTVLLIGAVPSASKSLLSPRSRRHSTSTRFTTIGFYTASPWVESPTSMTGSSDCFLFAFDDTANAASKDSSIQFFPAIPPPKTATTSSSHNNTQGYVCCNPSHLLQRNSNVSTSTTGIGIGGSPSQPRLHLTESLEECRVLDYCGSFQDGDLLLGNCIDCSNNYFDVEAMEVWAVGGEEWIRSSLEQQQKQQAIVESQRLQKARLSDKRHFLEDLQLMSTSGGGGVSHYQSGGGYFAHQAYVDTNDGRCDV